VIAPATNFQEAKLENKSFGFGISDFEIRISEGGFAVDPLMCYKCTWKPAC